MVKILQKLSFSREFITSWKNQSSSSSSWGRKSCYSTYVEAEKERQIRNPLNSNTLSTSPPRLHGSATRHSRPIATALNRPTDVVRSQTTAWKPRRHSSWDVVRGEWRMLAIFSARNSCVILPVNMVTPRVPCQYKMKHGKTIMLTDKVMSSIYSQYKLIATAFTHW